MRIIRHSFVRLIIIIVCLFLCVGLVRSIVENVRRSDLVSERQVTLEKERQRNSALQEKLREATSSAFIEKQAREKLGLVREGETVVLIGESHMEGQENTIQETYESLWKRWWRLFF
jgi:cell division protein FtsB